ncbi:MAG: bifunctional (p)ppGpp synthetase/guanosine-3',5'-bis(diphosphate) 3'-pyrophosphohydrolase [Candidatus Latescibacteria bacterium]|nr:bifunctional (p)ppGpp synthetase/guanosine-3',5'-bis(diphosphate) 3'-pyrophosphohydrolase [Candidatus Latescibacterota bacterium]
MSESSAHSPPDPEPTALVPAQSLDFHLEQARDHLQLQMLLIELGSCNDQVDCGLIARAYHFAEACHTGQKRLSGEPYIHHCVEVARILIQLRLDSATVAAGLLHDVFEDSDATIAQITTVFSPKIASLIDGVTKMDRLTYESQEARQAETFRKMLLSMVEDIRVILIKFADRLHNMRTLEAMAPEQQRRIARETLEVYAPLAHRLGLARMRWELEDLSFKYLEPAVYREVRDKVAMKRREREVYIEEFKAPIEKELAQGGIEAEITGRPKNFYSIYNKMKSRGRPFEEIYDLLAVRITVHSVRECYHTLGLAHTLYHPVPGRFKDYIATPKSNMYQSLHTSVIGPRGIPVEIQIRTWEMHHTAEIGIAAHWRYKAGRRDPTDLDQHIHWLRQVLDWQREATDPKEFMENLKIELFQDEIFVFTPKGRLVQLPKGAVPIDFAFAVHTDIGLRCLAAKVNGQLVPLGTELKSGDAVQIFTSPQQKPRQAWLELIKTSKARNRIQHWLKEEQHGHSVHLGQEMLERELKRYRYKLQAEALDRLAQEFSLVDGEHVLSAIGQGDLSVNRVVNRLLPPLPRRHTPPQIQDKRGIRIQGMDNMMIQFARCCSPAPGDTILGLITRGRGVSVHRADCHNIAEQMAADPDRLLPVEWDLAEEQVFTVQLVVRSNDRKYLLSDISKTISDTGANIRSSTTDTAENWAIETFWVDVQNSKQLQELIRKVYQVEGVLEVRRGEIPQPRAPLLPERRN